MRVAITLIYFLLLVGIVVLSSNNFVLAGGSDAGVQIFSSSIIVKAISAVVCAACLIFSLWLRNKNLSVLIASLLVTTMLMGLASHSLVLNHRHGVLEERWLLLKFDRVNYNIAEGIGHTWRAKPTKLGVQLVSKESGKSVFIFTGPSPWLTPFATFGRTH